MYIENELKIIAQRLFDEKICLHPLCDSDLNKIYRFMGMSESGGELMRRLSDIEINYDEISTDADKAVACIKESIGHCTYLFKSYIDSLSENGLIGNFTFSLSKADISKIYQNYSMTAEALNREIEKLSAEAEDLSEIALQARACSVSFLEICNETRFAFYAASLNKDKECILTCRAISMQAHDSSKESSAKATRYQSVSNCATFALSVINSILSEASAAFSGYELGQKASVTAIANIFIRGTETLKNIVSSYKL